MTRTRFLKADNLLVECHQGQVWNEQFLSNPIWKDLKMNKELKIHWMEDWVDRQMDRS